VPVCLLKLSLLRLTVIFVLITQCHPTFGLSALVCCILPFTFPFLQHWRYWNWELDAYSLEQRNSDGILKSDNNARWFPFFREVRRRWRTKLMGPWVRTPSLTTTPMWMTRWSRVGRSRSPSGRPCPWTTRATRTPRPRPRRVSRVDREESS